MKEVGAARPRRIGRAGDLKAARAATQSHVTANEPHSSTANRNRLRHNLPARPLPVAVPDRAFTQANPDINPRDFFMAAVCSGREHVRLGLPLGKALDLQALRLERLGYGPELSRVWLDGFEVGYGEVRG